MVKCTVCQDSGKTAGSYDLDCTHCAVADQRVALNEFSHNASDAEGDLADLLWAIHQRAVEQERAKARAALGEIINKYAVGDYSAHDLLHAEYERIAP